MAAAAQSGSPRRASGLAAAAAAAAAADHISTVLPGFHGSSWAGGQAGS